MKSNNTGEGCRGRKNGEGNREFGGQWPMRHVQANGKCRTN